MTDFKTKCTKCTKFDFGWGWGFRSQTALQWWSLQCSPGLLATRNLKAFTGK